MGQKYAYTQLQDKFELSKPNAHEEKISLGF